MSDGFVIAAVAGLHLSPAHRAPMIEVGHVDVVLGQGLVGDRFFGSRHRQVSVQSRGQLDEASRVLGAEILSGLTRRNVTLERGKVPSIPGARIAIGDDVLLEVVRQAAPCRIMDEVIGAGARRALHGRGGAVCRILSSGRITIGDLARFLR